MKQTKGFIIDAVSDTYWYPVNVDLIDQEGKTERFVFEAKFLRLPDDEQKDIFNPAEGQTIPKDSELLDRVFLGWRHVRTAAGEEVPYNPETRTQLLAISPTPSRIVMAWLKSIGIEGKAKN